MNGRKAISWAILTVAMLFFVVPLLATLEYAMRQIGPGGSLFTFMGKGHSFDAFFTSIVSPDFQIALERSLVLAIVSIVLGVLLVVPTVYLIRLKFPAWRSPAEFISLLPLVVPAIIIGYGYIFVWIVPAWSPFKDGIFADVLLSLGYVALALPYMYRSVDIGMRAIDVKTLTEAAQSLGASGFSILFKVILPNVRTAVLSGAFVTFAIVIGEFTIATVLNRNVFGTYLAAIGKVKAFEPSALAIVAFLITWVCMGLLQLVGGSRGAKPAR